MLKKKLKKALKEAGLSEELANVINITSEDQIGELIDQLKPTRSDSDEPDFEEILQSSEFAGFVKDKGFDTVLKLSKTLRSEHDKKVTRGIKTFSDKYFKKIDPDGDDPGEEEDGKAETATADDTPAWAKSLIEKVNNIEKKDRQSGQLEQAQDLLKKSKLPEKLQQKWIERIDLESDTSFDDQIKELEEEYGELHRSLVGENSGKGLPLGSQTEGKATEAEVDAIVDGLL